jgi:hypothetical protein
VAAVNDLERPIGTYLYGRRMYETMVFWETASTGADQSTGVCDFAELWAGWRQERTAGQGARSASASA